MSKKSVLAILVSLPCLSAALLLTGCDDTPSCPSPTAEPAKTVAAVAATAPNTQMAAKAEQAKTVAKPVTTVAKPSPSEPDPIEDVDVDADLYVKRLVVARGVEAREPVEPATSFAKSEGKRIYAFVEVGNRGQSASEVYVSFKPVNGKERGRIPLRVGASPRWRTWAYTELAEEVGEWEAIVRNPRDEIIGKQRFTVTAEPVTDDPYADIDAS